MISKTKISKRIAKKNNPELVETIKLCKKDNEVWMKVARIISGSTSKRPSFNLEKINELAEEDKVVLIPGKVLGQGEVSKKIKIVALNFSENAKDKLNKGKINYCSISEEIKNNPSGEKIKILENKNENN